MTEVHLLEARTHAYRLFAVASAIYPQEWAGAQVVEPALIDLSNFAYHARRVNDLCGYKTRAFDAVDAVRYGFSPDQDIPLVSDYREALNRLHHASELTFNWSVLERPRVFTSSPQNLVASYLRVETENWKEAANISIFGLAFCFLSSVLPAVMAGFPVYRF